MNSANPQRILLVLKFRRTKMTELFQRGEIKNQIPNRNAHTRFALSRLENAEGKILQRKMRIR